MARKRGLDFVWQLIKGKAAEIIFQHMFAENNFCTVIPFGYEHSQPLLAQYQHLIQSAEALANIRNAPDFILVKPDNTEIVLVDVKYRKRKDPQRVLEIARAISTRWETAWIFLATLDGFYFEPCRQIIEDGGEIGLLPTQWIKREIQDEYLTLLRDFER